MKKRSEYIDIRDDLKELLFWIKDESDQEVNLYQEILLNVLRIITDKTFRNEIQTLRRKFSIPSSWYKEKKFKLIHMAVWRNKKLNDIQKELGNSYIIEEDQWIKNNPETFNNLQSWDDKLIVELAVKYNLHPRRYGDFLIEYLYFGCLVPSIFTTFEWFTEDESRYKTRFEFEPENPPNSGIVGCIRFFQDTSISQLQEFIKTHSAYIENIKKHLEKYPIQQKNRSDTFKFHLKVYLMYCIGYTDTDINCEFPETDTSNIRKDISIMKKRIRLSADTTYHKPTSATVKKS